MRKTWFLVKYHPWLTLVLLLVLAYFGHKAYLEIGRWYFDSQCKSDAGEFIYKTVEGVEGIYQIRPREPVYSLDVLRNYWKYGRGELMEDPYGYTDMEGQQPWTLFVRAETDPTIAYQYMETIKKPELVIGGHRYRKITLEEKLVDKGYPYWIYRSVGTVSPDSYMSLYSVTNTDKLQSRYGFTWREVRSRWDKIFGIWGGETVVLDLKKNETLAIKRGYFSFNYGRCLKENPKENGSFFINKFLIKVLKPVKK